MTSGTNSAINSTMTSATPSRCTVIFIGNPSRGDDGVGPLLFQEMEDWLNGRKNVESGLDNNGVQLIDTFQLEPELCCDIENTEALILVDASTAIAPSPWIEKIPHIAPVPEKEPKESAPLPVWTHSMPPVSLLMLFTQLYHKPAPSSYILHIPGQTFELGAALSSQVSDHKAWCLDFLKKCCQTHSSKDLQVFIESVYA